MEEYSWPPHTSLDTGFGLFVFGLEIISNLQKICMNKNNTKGTSYTLYSDSFMLTFYPIVFAVSLSYVFYIILPIVLNCIIMTFYPNTILLLNFLVYVFAE